jgi:thymidylate synthase (FAD)
MEFVRHRVFSFAQESTRYCNYSKDKFGNELTFIAPEWLIDWDVEAINDGLWDNSDDDAKVYADVLSMAEKSYFFLLGCPNKWTPQQARAVLPNSLKTELLMTGFVSDWKEFFHLRTSEKAHPQARELAIPLYKEFEKRKLI